MATKITIDKIKFKHGVEENLPSLDQGEPALTDDTQKVFVGTYSGQNLELAKKDDVDAVDVKVNGKASQADLEALSSEVSTKADKIYVDDTVGPLVNLTTTNKSNVVSAVNELGEKIVNNSSIVKQDVEPVGAAEGTVWLDTGDNAFQGTVFESLNTQLAQSVSQLNSGGINLKYPPAPMVGAKDDCVLDANGNFVSGTDNTQIINNLIDAVPTGGTLIIPYGKYLYHYIEKFRSDINIIGLNATLVSSVIPDDAKSCIYLQGSNVYIEGINFRFNRPFNYDTTYKPPAFGTSNHVRLGGGRPTDPNGGWQSNIRMVRCTVDGGYSGGIDFYYAYDVQVVDCDVTNTLGNGINFANCLRDVTAYNCRVKNVRDDGIQCTVDSNVPYGTINYHVEKCKVENSYAKGISSTGSFGGRITNNTVVNTWTGGIQPFQDVFYNLGIARNMLVENNTIINAGKNFGTGKFKTSASNNSDGIYLSSGADGVDLFNNRIISPRRYGIFAGNGITNSRIKWNRIRGCGSTGILVGDINNTAYTSCLGIEIEENEIIDVQGYLISVGGAIRATIRRNRGRSFGRTNYPIYAKNVSSVLNEGNVIGSNVVETWKPNMYYYEGMYIVPTTGNSHCYKCTKEGQSGLTEPTWDITTAATTTDNGVTWLEDGNPTKGTTTNLFRQEGTNVAVTDRLTDLLWA